jgi:hypothetical protein
MEREGPPLEQLTRRLAETPREFLAPPRIGGRGQVAVAAVVHDLLAMHGLDAALGKGDELDQFTEGSARALGLTLLLAWLLADDGFREQGLAAPAVLTLLGEEARELSKHLRPDQVCGDPERREELARVALARLGLRPLGETEAQARDRLSSLSSRERARVLQASRAAEERARKLRAELAKKAAQESADKWTRE